MSFWRKDLGVKSLKLCKIMVPLTVFKCVCVCLFGDIDNFINTYRFRQWNSNSTRFCFYIRWTAKFIDVLVLTNSAGYVMKHITALLGIKWTIGIMWLWFQNTFLLFYLPTWEALVLKFSFLLWKSRFT